MFSNITASWARTKVSNPGPRTDCYSWNAQKYLQEIRQPWLQHEYDMKVSKGAKIRKKVFVQYGFLWKLHSGNGGNFESKVIKNLCDIANMKKTRAIPYHHMGNGKFVRFYKKNLRCWWQRQTKRSSLACLYLDTV